MIVKVIVNIGFMCHQFLHLFVNCAILNIRLFFPICGFLRQFLIIQQAVLLQIAERLRHLFEIEFLCPMLIPKAFPRTNFRFNIDEQAAFHFRGMCILLTGRMLCFARDYDAKRILRIPFTQRAKPNALLLFDGAERDMRSAFDLVARIRHEFQEHLKVSGLLLQSTVNRGAQ